ncbi:MAG: flagellin [Opitutae bacterium]|nr:flagellin [Opitutae bacterium]
MRIPTQSVSDGITRQLAQLSSRQAKLQNQVATGQRIFQPEDDPAAVGRVLTIQSERSQVQQFARNADHALQISQASFAGLQAVKRISDRAGELATLGEGAISPESFHAYSTEIDQLLEQGLQQANTKLGNDFIFAGTAADASPFTATRNSSGKITALTYNGTASSAPIQISETSTLTPGTGGATNQNLADFLNRLVSLRDALQAGSTTAVAAVRSPLDDSENKLIEVMGETGAVQTRIEVAKDQLISRFHDSEKLISNETDADLPETIVKLTQTQTAYQAALQSASSIMKLSLLDYLR